MPIYMRDTQQIFSSILLTQLQVQVKHISALHQQILTPNIVDIGNISVGREVCCQYRVLDNVYNTYFNKISTLMLHKASHKAQKLLHNVNKRRLSAYDGPKRIWNLFELFACFGDYLPHLDE